MKDPMEPSLRDPDPMESSLVNLRRKSCFRDTKVRPSNVICSSTHQTKKDFGVSYEVSRMVQLMSLFKEVSDYVRWRGFEHNNSSRWELCHILNRARGKEPEYDGLNIRRGCSSSTKDFPAVRYM
ncbi:hypothetical protein NPIL_465621 [Nephila pilipes]|uniref:Uncharacterized protein n=1 Tax=Nephila pilipes TaxID=299642 RepID=A0A8X6TTX4_NEPPI|nr:hypothetical protein NPIL_465621 [Nephila pilipes]